MGDVMVLVFVATQLAYYGYAKRHLKNEKDVLVILGAQIVARFSQPVLLKLLKQEEVQKIEKLYPPGQWLEGKRRYLSMKMGAVYLILVVGVFLSVAIGKDFSSSHPLDNVVSRPEFGEDAQEMELAYKVNSWEGIVEGHLPIVIAPRLPEEGDRVAYLESLYTPLLYKMIGEGGRADFVEDHLNFEATPFDTPVEVTYQPLTNDYIDHQGKLRFERMKLNQGYQAQVMVEMSLEEDVFLATYDLTVVKTPMSITEEVGQLEDRMVISDEAIILPENLSENMGTIDWIAPTKGVWVGKLLAGTLLFALLGHSIARVRLTLMLEKHREAILYDFPKLVSQLTMLITAGMTFKRAWFKIVEDYKKRSDAPRPLYEEMVVATAQMRNGLPEKEALEAFGRRTENREVMRMTTILIQNLKLGGNALAAALNQLSSEAWDIRINTARIQGEKASTRLLIPLGISFGALLLIILGSTLMSLKL